MSTSVLYRPNVGSWEIVLPAASELDFGDVLEHPGSVEAWPEDSLDAYYRRRAAAFRSRPRLARDADDWDHLLQ